MEQRKNPKKNSFFIDKKLKYEKVTIVLLIGIMICAMLTGCGKSASATKDGNSLRLSYEDIEKEDGSGIYVLNKDKTFSPILSDMPGYSGSTDRASSERYVWYTDNKTNITTLIPTVTQGTPLVAIYDSSDDMPDEWYLERYKNKGYTVGMHITLGDIHHVTIERTPTGKYFVVLNVDFEPKPFVNAGGVLGIDVGIKDFYTDSNGNTVSNPKYLERSEKKLAREQRKLSRKQKGSRNRSKQRMKVALLHERIVNQRNDFLQKESTMLIRENQTIWVENLHVKGMIRNHKLAKSIVSVSWSRFFWMLQYKAKWYGNNLIKVPTLYPSSQTCSNCGYKNPLVKNLAVRRWECPFCHTVHGRDTNASINILRKGLEMQFA